MTREEAIAYIKQNCYGEWCEDDWRDAMDVAIKALETQPDGDCISRRAFRSRIETEYRRWGDEYDAYQVLSDLDDFPSVQPEITPDGTLNISINADVASVGRILLSQAGTQRGGLYYKDEQPDMSSYSDKLWRSAYERGKAEAQAEIVRCKDCKHFIKDHGWNRIEYTVCSISPIHKVIRQPDDFCSRSERRTDD